MTGAAINVNMMINTASQGGFGVKKLVSILLILILCLAPMTALASYPDFSVLNGSDILRRGSKGSYVRRLQQRLSDLGYLNGSADGSYGSKTESAVAAFKRKNGFGGNNGACGVATMLTQAVLFGSDIIPAWDNSSVMLRGSGSYGIRNVDCMPYSHNQISVEFDFVNQDSTFNVSNMCIYYWLADSRNRVVTMNGNKYWMQWYYNMAVPPNGTKNVSLILSTNASEWKKIATVRCVVGEIGYNNGCVISTVNPANQPYENSNYILYEW